MSDNVFSEYLEQAYKYGHKGTLTFRESVHGGTPTNESVATAWIQSKMTKNDEELKKLVQETMEARQIDEAQAIKIVGDLKLLKGFKRDDNGLYLEGRVLKSCLKEGTAVALAAGKVTNTRAFGVGKAGIRSFLPEHLFVKETKLYLKDKDTKANITEPTNIQQRFVTTFRGTGITYEEVVENAYLDFTLVSDYKFDDQFWAMVWLTAGEIGLGASRSLSYGRFDVTSWEAN